MRRVIVNWIKNKLNLFAASKRLKIAGVGFAIIFFGTTALVAGSTIRNQKVAEVPAPTLTAQEDSNDGEVAGATTEETTSPTPTPFTTRKIVPTSTPTSTPAPAPNNNESSSDNNQQNNNSSNNSSSQSQNNSSTQTSSATPTPTATPTQEPTPTPTPDNSPFEAEWNVSWNGNQVSATVGASKPLKRCLYEIWGGSLSLAGEANGEGYGCRVGGSASGANKIWVQAESIYGETKDFGEKPPSQGNVQI